VGFNPVFRASDLNIGSGKMKSITSVIEDAVSKSKQQPSGNLFEIKANASRSNGPSKVGLAKWLAIREQLMATLPMGKETLEIAVLLSTHKNIVDLSSIRKMDTEMFAAELLLNFVFSPPKRKEASVGWIVLPKKLLDC
jgi:hypothetical protein